MKAERLLLDTDQKGNLKGLPIFPPNKQVEVIFLIIDRPDQKICMRRFPHRDIAGKMRIMGNIFETASEDDWNLPDHHSDPQDRIIIATALSLDAQLMSAVGKFPQSVLFI